MCTVYLFACLLVLMVRVAPRSSQSAVYYTNSPNTAASGILSAFCFLLSAFWISSSASYRVPVVSLPSLRRHVPGRRSGPWFSGVTQLPAGSCFLLFCPLPLLLVLLPPLPLCCLNSATDESNLNPWRLSACQRHFCWCTRACVPAHARHS